MVTENLKKVEKKIESACTRAGRDRNDVTLIAVSKTKPVEMMRNCGKTKRTDRTVRLAYDWSFTAK